MSNSKKRWQLSLEYQVVSDEDVLSPGDKRVPTLDNWLAREHEGGALATKRGWITKVIVPVSSQVRSMDHAEIYGERLIAYFLKTLQFPASRIISRSVIEADAFVARLEVYGSRELSELLNVSRQRLAQLRAEGTLPEPDAALAATPVWKRSTVEGFLWGWRRRPGPPPTTKDVDMDRLVSGE